MANKSTYFELKYNGPFKGINVDLPANIIDKPYSPSFLNFILKNGEIRTRPRQLHFIPSPTDNRPISIISTFKDDNGVYHTIVVTQNGLWQLNSNWRANVSSKTAWNLVGAFQTNPINLPTTAAVFLNKFFWSSGSNNLWMWDGISSVGSSGRWQKDTQYLVNNRVIDSNGDLQVCIVPGVSGAVEPTWNITIGQNTAEASGLTWVNNGEPAFSNGFQSIAVVDATNGITAGCKYLMELNFHLVMLNTFEGKLDNFQNFRQRIRWSPSGISNIWDPNVNIGAGYNDMLDVPDSITGGMTVGRVGYILRDNGITEMTPVSSSTSPFDFDHLWASKNGIGNVLANTVANYGPIGMFVAEDDVYNLSLNGFKRTGGVARDAIYSDIAASSDSDNILATIVPRYANNYIYPTYKLFIPFGQDTKIWNYSIEDDSWQVDYKTNITITGFPNFVSTR